MQPAEWGVCRDEVPAGHPSNHSKPDGVLGLYGRPSHVENWAGFDYEVGSVLGVGPVRSFFHTNHPSSSLRLVLAPEPNGGRGKALDIRGTVHTIKQLYCPASSSRCAASCRGRRALSAAEPRSASC